jgi:ribosome-associated heat shock protein Hsp15
VDKWLWAARFYKTRALAVEEIDKGRIHVNGAVPKPAREVGEGDLVTIRKEHEVFNVYVRKISAVRGPAPVARELYEETPESIKARERALALRRLAPEPAQGIRDGRPTKRDRRLIDDFRGR